MYVTAITVGIYYDGNPVTHRIILNGNTVVSTCGPGLGLLLLFQWHNIPNTNISNIYFLFFSYLFVYTRIM